MRYRKGWIALLVMAVLTPLGIIAIGGAWGEWDLQTVEELSGHAPEGMRKAQEARPDAPLPDYEVPGLGEGPFGSGIGTILTALVGAAATAVAVLVIGRISGRIS
jgi:hypothetical protein